MKIILLLIGIFLGFVVLANLSAWIIEFLNNFSNRGFKSVSKSPDNILRTGRKRAKYGPTLTGEVSKNLDLIHNEKIITQTPIRLARYGILALQGYIVVTDLRVFVLEHYLLKPDAVISIVWKDIKNVELSKSMLLGGNAVHLEFSMAGKLQRIHFLVVFLRSIPRGIAVLAKDDSSESLYKEIKSRISN